METFRRGAHISSIDGVLQATIRQPCTPATCGSRLGCRSNDAFMVKPRGSPCVWKLYVVDEYAIRQVFKHADADVVMAYAALMLR